MEVVDVNELMDELVAHLGEYRPDVSIEVNVEGTCIARVHHLIART